MAIKLIKLLALALIFIAFIKAYFIYFERRSIYYPLSTLDFTPTSIGLAYEDVFFKTRDGVILNGWYIPAKDSLPVLLFCHGNAGNISHRLDSIKLFNELGLNVFIFDYRGYGKSKGRVTEQGTYLDTKAAYAYLINERGHTIQEIVIFGRSLGGACAVDLAVRAEEGLLILEGLFCSVQKIGQEVYPFLPVGLLSSIKYDSLSKIKEVKIPKLIIHSRDDEIIPFHHGQELYEAAKEPKEFYEMKGSHNEAFLAVGNEYELRLKEFLERYLEND